MAPPAKSVRVVFGGSLNGGEVWSTGFWTVDHEATFNQDTAQALALYYDGLASGSGSTGAMSRTLENIMTTSSNWQTTKTYLYTGGSNTAAFAGEYVKPTPIAGSQSSHMPNQVCLVATLRSGLPGRRNRGRMYLPAGGGSLDTASGEFGSALIQTIATDWAALFTEINQGQDATAAIVSNAGSTSTPIHQVTVDSRCDIQRRRANKQAISYTVTGQVSQ